MAYWHFCTACQEWSKSATPLTDDKACSFCGKKYNRFKKNDEVVNTTVEEVPYQIEVTDTVAETAAPVENEELELIGEPAANSEEEITEDQDQDQEQDQAIISSGDVGEISDNDAATAEIEITATEEVTEVAETETTTEELGASDFPTTDDASIADDAGAANDNLLIDDIATTDDNSITDDTDATGGSSKVKKTAAKKIAVRNNTRLTKKH